MGKEEKKGFEKYILYTIYIVIPLFAVVLGVLLQKYLLAKSPKLSYEITESQPIPTGVKDYYTTAFYVSNTGNVPLKNVVLNAPFRDTIATIRIHPSLTKNGNVITDTVIEPDSLTLEISFDLAPEEQCSVTIVSAGRLRPESFKLKSDQVLGTKMEIRRTPQMAWWQVAIVVIVAVAPGLAVLLYWWPRLVVAKREYLYVTKEADRVLDMLKEVEKSIITKRDIETPASNKKRENSV